MTDIEVHFDDVVLDLAGKPPLQAEILERAVQQTLTEPVLKVMKEQALAGQGPAVKVELTLVVTGDEALQELNRRYLEIDAPTDVLSFPAGEVNPESGALYLGDIAISYPRAQAQAALVGHPVAAEMQLLVVHGVLHLLGYDHAGSSEKAAMWEIQDQVLEALGSAARSPR
jgi:probable rRNA maturation factor